MHTLHPGTILRNLRQQVFQLRQDEGRFDDAGPNLLHCVADLRMRGVEVLGRSFDRLSCLSGFAFELLGLGGWTGCAVRCVVRFEGACLHGFVGCGLVIVAMVTISCRC